MSPGPSVHPSSKERRPGDGHRAPELVTEDVRGMMSRRRFLELGLFAIVGLGLIGGAGCGGRSVLRPGIKKERTGAEGQEEDQEQRRRRQGWFGLGRIIRLLLRGMF